MKFCSSCGCQLDDATVFCPNCGAQQTDATAAPQSYSVGAAKKIPDKRGLLKLILFSFITFGIYSLVVMVKISCEINTIASRYDGKRTMNFILVVLLSGLTFGILPIVWEHSLCNRIGNELHRRGIGYSFSAATFWGWGVLGTFLFGIGPFVFAHKFFKAMNLLAANYNRMGC